MLSLLRIKPTTQSNVVVDDNDLSSWELVNHTDDDDEEIEQNIIYSFDDVIITDQPEPTTTFPVNAEDDVISGQLENSMTSDDVEKDDDDDEVYGDELDDDLVPWELKGRFGKQRMGKVMMGKKCVPKSKYKLPCYYHHKPKTNNILVR